LQDCIRKPIDGSVEVIESHDPISVKESRLILEAPHRLVETGRDGSFGELFDVF
jgi:hypothetical protein